MSRSKPQLALRERYRCGEVLTRTCCHVSRACRNPPTADRRTLSSEPELSPVFDFTGSLLHLLHRASQIADDLFSSRKELEGLTSRQFIVLAAVKGRDGISQTDITLATGIDRSTLTDLVGRLHAKGLVARNRSRIDARSYEVRLTAEGDAVLAAAIPIVKEIDRRLMESAPPAAKDELVKLLGFIAKADS